jgi:hypothetical protein
MFLPFPKNINTQLLIDNMSLIQEEYKSFTYTDFFDYSCVKTGTTDLLKNPQSTEDAVWQVRPLMFQYNRWPNRESKTIELLENLGVKPILATFSRLAPLKKIDTHTDHDETTVGAVDTTVVKYHITLEADNDGESVLIVGNESRVLKEGDINCFDESTPHSVYNNGTKHRGVLLISWLRKDLEL